MTDYKKYHSAIRDIESVIKNIDSVGLCEDCKHEIDLPMETSVLSESLSVIEDLPSILEENEEVVEDLISAVEELLDNSVDKSEMEKICKYCPNYNCSDLTLCSLKHSLNIPKFVRDNYGYDLASEFQETVFRVPRACPYKLEMKVLRKIP